MKHFILNNYVGIQYSHIIIKGAMRCLQVKPYKYTCYSCQAAANSNEILIKNIEICA